MIRACLAAKKYSPAARETATDDATSSTVATISTSTTATTSTGSQMQDTAEILARGFRPIILRSSTGNKNVDLSLDPRTMSASTLQKNGVTVHLLILGEAHLQKLYSRLPANVKSQDIHKYDAEYQAIRAEFRRQLKKHPELVDGQTFSKHQFAAQGRIVTYMQDWAREKRYHWAENDVLIRALIQQMCTGAKVREDRQAKRARIFARKFLSIA